MLPASPRYAAMMLRFDMPVDARRALIFVRVHVAHLPCLRAKSERAPLFCAYVARLFA